MNPTLLEIIQTHGNRTESTCYCELTPSLVTTGKAELKEGFYFLLVTNGTAQLTDEYQTYELQPAHLVILTPQHKVHDSDYEFSLPGHAPLSETSFL